MLATVPEVLADLSGIKGEKSGGGFRTRLSGLGSRPPHLEERQGPPRRAQGFGGSGGEHRVGKRAGQSLPSTRAGYLTAVDC